MKSFSITVLAAALLLGSTAAAAQVMPSPLPNMNPATGQATMPAAGPTAGTPGDPNGARSRLTPEERAMLEAAESNPGTPLPVSGGDPAPAAGAVAAAAVAAPAPGTSAAEQGFVDPKEVARLRLEMEDEIAFGSAYQRGEVLQTSARWSNPVARDNSRSAWLSAWRQKLAEFGVPASKVQFEASRLPADLFERWASRQVWARQELPSAF